MDAYVEGRISRRTLIRRLVASGVSVGAAVAYAHILAPRAKAVDRLRVLEYPTVHLSIKSDDLQQVIRDKRLRVAVRSAERATLRLDVYAHKDGARKLIGDRRVRFDEPGRKVVGIALDTVAPLRHRQRAKVTVEAHWHTTDQLDHELASDSTVLT